MNNKYRIDDAIVHIKAKYRGGLVEFMVDLEDLEFITSFPNSWYINVNGYVYHQVRVNNKHETNIVN